MRKLTIISFSIVLLLFVSVAHAQVQYYGIDVVLNDKGTTTTKLTLTFSHPIDSFDFTVFGTIKNFEATSNAGPVVCNLEMGQATLIKCPLELTLEKRTVDIIFETDDFVKLLEKKFYFSGDFSLNENIDQVFASVKLPEGMAIVGDELSPESSSTISDGRSIIIIWQLEDINKDQRLSFHVMYERTQPIFKLRLRHFAVLGAVLAVVLGFILIRYIKKPQDVILSVLDDFERQIMDIIVASGGNVNQKKIVKETNLSKAKVSRVIKSLEERNLIEVERRGRTNIIKIAKKKFKYL